MTKIRSNKDVRKEAIYEKFVNINGQVLLSPLKGDKDAEAQGLEGVYLDGEKREGIILSGMTFFVNLKGTIASAILVRASSTEILASSGIILASDSPDSGFIKFTFILTENNELLLTERGEKLIY